MPKTHANYIGINLEGKKFNKLTVIKLKEGTRSQWLCKCDCGNEKVVYAHRLIKGITKSCGCYEIENRKNLRKRATKHGMTETILYRKWCSIKERCYNPHYRYFNRYGGRGITMCPEWLGEHGFENFAIWAYEAGYDNSKKHFNKQ